MNISLNRRQLLFGVAAAIVVDPQQAAAVEGASFNEYAATYRDRGLGKTMVTRPGQTWQSIFGKRMDIAKMLNRQNVQLEQGQVVIVPAENATVESISPFAKQTDVQGKVLHISMRKYAWGLYDNQRLLAWGPAIGGTPWNQRLRRGFKTPSGTFKITEIAGPDRRSNKYPKEAALRGEGAPMPYYMRLTKDGVGIHARYLRGTHISHGCIGMFYGHAQWLNKNHARDKRMEVVVESYGLPEYV